MSEYTDGWLDAIRAEGLLANEKEELDRARYHERFWITRKDLRRWRCCWEDRWIKKLPSRWRVADLADPDKVPWVTADEREWCLRNWAREQTPNDLLEADIADASLALSDAPILSLENFAEYFGPLIDEWCTPQEPLSGPGAPPESGPGGDH